MAAILAKMKEEAQSGSSPEEMEMSLNTLREAVVAHPRLGSAAIRFFREALHEIRELVPPKNLECSAIIMGLIRDGLDLWPRDAKKPALKMAKFSDT